MLPYLLTSLVLAHSRAILQEVLEADLSDEAFPFSTHKLVRAAGHLVGSCPGAPGLRVAPAACGPGTNPGLGVSCPWAGFWISWARLPCSKVGVQTVMPTGC